MKRPVVDALRSRQPSLGQGQRECPSTEEPGRDEQLSGWEETGVGGAILTLRSREGSCLSAPCFRHTEEPGYVYALGFPDVLLNIH